MKSFIYTLCDAATGTGRKTAMSVTAERKAISIYINGTATAKVECSNDPTVETDPDNAIWHDLTADISSSTGLENGFPWRYLAANIVSGAGEVTIHVAVLE